MSGACAKQKGLCFDELLLPPAEKRIDVEAGIHLAELPQHLRLVPTLEGHHLPLWTLSSRPAGGLAEAHRAAELGDLLEEELLVVADLPALPAQREDDGGLGVVLLAESEKDLRAALVEAVVQIAPELLLHGLGGGEDFFQGAQDGVGPPDLRQGPLGRLGF